MPSVDLTGRIIDTPKRCNTKDRHEAHRWQVGVMEYLCDGKGR